MEKYGVIRNGAIIERFSDKREGQRHFLNMLKDGIFVGFRELKFHELTEDEKLEGVKAKLESLNLFLEDMRGSGRSYNSKTLIEFDAFKWLVESTSKLVSQVSNEQKGNSEFKAQEVKRYGLFKLTGELMRELNEAEKSEGERALIESIRIGNPVIFRELKFHEYTEIERTEAMTKRLNDFLNKPTQFTMDNYSKIKIDVDELKWLVDSVDKYKTGGDSYERNDL